MSVLAMLKLGDAPGRASHTFNKGEACSAWWACNTVLSPSPTWIDMLGSRSLIPPSAKLPARASGQRVPLAALPLQGAKASHVGWLLGAMQQGALLAPTCTRCSTSQGALAGALRACLGLQQLAAASLEGVGSQARL